MNNNEKIGCSQPLVVTSGTEEFILETRERSANKTNLKTQTQTNAKQSQTTVMQRFWKSEMTIQTIVILLFCKLLPLMKKAHLFLFQLCLYQVCLEKKKKKERKKRGRKTSDFFTFLLGETVHSVLMFTAPLQSRYEQTNTNKYKHKFKQT